MTRNVMLSRRGVKGLLGTVGGKAVESPPADIERTKEEIDAEVNAEPLDLSSEYGSEPGLEAAPYRDIGELEIETEKENEREIKKSYSRSRTRALRNARGVLSEGQGRPAPSLSPGSNDSSKRLKRKREEPPIDLSDLKDGSNERPSATQEPPPATQDEMKYVMGSQPRNIHAYSSQRQKTQENPRNTHGSQRLSQGIPKGKKVDPRKSGAAASFHRPPNSSSKGSVETKPRSSFKEPPKSVAGLKPELASFKTPSSPMCSATSSSGLSSPPLSSDDGFAAEDEASFMAATQPVDDTPRCPMCNGAVEAEKLSALRAKCRKGVPTRQQAMRFCEEHKARDARSHWSASRYPLIDWDNFDSRLERFHHQLILILEQRALSTFRKELEEKAKPGQLTKRLRDVDASAVGRNAGYFGEQGAERMTDHILAHFRKNLRKATTTDKLYMDLGVAGVMQDILVPELTLLLIREDFSCDEARAMEVLKESGEIGEIFNQEKVGDPFEDFQRDMEIKAMSEHEDSSDVKLSDDEFVDIESLEEAKPSKASMEIVDTQQFDKSEPAKQRRTGRAVRPERSLSLCSLIDQ